MYSVSSCISKCSDRQNNPSLYLPGELPPISLYPPVPIQTSASWRLTHTFLKGTSLCQNLTLQLLFPGSSVCPLLDLFSWFGEQIFNSFLRKDTGKVNFLKSWAFDWWVGWVENCSGKSFPSEFWRCVQQSRSFHVHCWKKPIAVLLFLFVSAWIGFPRWKFLGSSPYSGALNFHDDLTQYGHHSFMCQALEKVFLLQTMNIGRFCRLVL